jgi:hypothetical protein
MKNEPRRVRGRNLKKIRFDSKNYVDVFPPTKKKTENGKGDGNGTWYKGEDLLDDDEEDIWDETRGNEMEWNGINSHSMKCRVDKRLHYEGEDQDVIDYYIPRISHSLVSYIL